MNIMSFPESFDKQTSHTVQAHREYICSTWFAHYQMFHCQLCFCYGNAFIVSHCAPCTANNQFLVRNSAFVAFILLS